MGAAFKAHNPAATAQGYRRAYRARVGSVVAKLGCAPVPPPRSDTVGKPVGLLVAALSVVAVLEVVGYRTGSLSIKPCSGFDAVVAVPPVAEKAA